MYELMCGSIFDTKCDMIVIPCDNYTNVTSMVLKSIYDYRIPRARNIMKPGEIEIYLNNRSLVNTSVICYAASVNAKNTKCEPEYLDRICSEIIDYCKENSINIVNIPLLGTGAGGLTIYESFDILKSHFTRSDSIKARIFAYTNDIYTKLRNHDPDSIKASIKVPRVFVSYTGIDNDNKIWVRRLVDKLRQNGVNARVDIYHLRLGDDLPQWMTDEIIMADKVLMICDKNYVIKADARKGGVGWETMLIQGDMMQHIHTNKYACIVREREIDSGLPVYARSKCCLHWANNEISEDEFKKLIKYLFDCPTDEPPLGVLPDYVRVLTN